LTSAGKPFTLQSWQEYLPFRHCRLSYEEISVQQLDIISMFLHAGLLAKLVMLILLGFSIVSWTIIFRKFTLFRAAKRESAQFTERFWQCRTLAEANEAAQEMELCPEAAVFLAGYGELQRLNVSRHDGERDPFTLRFASMENLQRTLRRTMNEQLGQFGGSLQFLATTGNATPFIGLFGTVWGIMTSFKDIGIRGSASLAIVAPGISEALIATAAGLAVAIPAVIFYNYFSNQLAELEDSMTNFADDFLNLVERDLLHRLRREK